LIKSSGWSADSSSSIRNKAKFKISLPFSAFDARGVAAALRFFASFDNIVFQSQSNTKGSAGGWYSGLFKHAEARRHGVGLEGCNHCRDVIARRWSKGSGERNKQGKKASAMTEKLKEQTEKGA
jgi:hypothetical protein